MPLILFHTRKVKASLEAPARVGTDLLLLVAIVGFFGGILMFAREVSAPYHEQVQISLSFRALPLYTFFSLSRGFAAYGLSLVFTLIYGTIAAHNQRAEKVMIPALDILQAIPVLGFLPGLVLAMIAIFPTRQIGLEIACIVMIFTGQVWNMTFSYHGSVRGIPQPLREVAAINRLSDWKIFKLLELPASMIGLVWNSMMSMAGGWFFLTVNEAFTLGNRDFRLPGIGSYMNEAINEGNVPAMIAAIFAMVSMIVIVDQFFWRPIVVWSQRFKMEETGDTDQPHSWVVDLLQKSFLFQRMKKKLRRAPASARSRVPMSLQTTSPQQLRLATAALTALKWIVLAGLAVGAVFGAWSLIRLLIAVPFNAKGSQDWLGIIAALGASFLRTTASVVIGALWTLPVGIMIGLSPRLSNRLQPLVQVMASFPAPMLFPLVTMLLILLHIPFTIGCVALMLLGAQWYILFNVIAGAMAIPADLKEVAKVYRFSEVQKWKQLYLPSVFPFLVTGLVTAAGGAWNATIVSEYLHLKNQTYIAFGLGSVISQATEDGNLPVLYAAVVTMAVSVVMINRFLWKKLYRLAEERYSLNV